MQNKFSSTLNAAFDGRSRSSTKETVKQPAKKTAQIKTEAVKGFPVLSGKPETIPDIEAVETDAKKLSRKKPGRKKMSDKDRKKQISITLKGATIEQLSAIDGYQKKLSAYIDDNPKKVLELISTIK